MSCAAGPTPAVRRCLVGKESEVSFTIRAKDAATAVLKQVEKSAQGTVEKLIGFKSILGAITGAIGAFSLATIIKDIVDIGTATDKTFRQMAANLPTAQAGLSRLKEEMNALAIASGRAKDEIEAAAVEITRLGVSN